MQTLTTIDGHFNINGEIYDQDYTNTITLNLPDGDQIYSHREINGRHYLFTSDGIYELKEQTDAFAKVDDQIFIGCKPVVDSGVIYIIGWREKAGSNGLGEFVAYNMASNTIIRSIDITATDLSSMKAFKTNQPRQDWYSGQSGINDKRFIFPCDADKCFMLIFYKSNSSTIVFELYTIRFNKPIQMLTMTGREEFMMSFGSSLRETRYYLFNKDNISSNININTTDTDKGSATHTFYDTVTVNSGISVSDIDYIGGIVAHTSQGTAIGVALVRATINGKVNQVCLMYRSNWNRGNKGRYIIIDNTLSFGTLDKLDCGSLLAVNDNIDNPEIVLANNNTIYHVKIPVANIYKLMNMNVDNDGNINSQNIQSGWNPPTIKQKFTFTNPDTIGRRELFTVDLSLKQLILKCENAIMYYDYESQTSPTIEGCMPIADHDTFIRAGRGFCSYDNIHMRIGRGGIVIDGPLINPMIQALRSTVAELLVRISALEAILNGGDLNVRSINGNLVGSGSGSVYDTSFTDNTYKVLPNIRHDGNAKDVNGQSFGAAYMEIGNVLDFHVPNTGGNTDKGTDHKTACNPSNGESDFCARIFVDRNNELWIKANGLHFLDNSNNKYNINTTKV